MKISIDFKVLWDSFDERPDSDVDRAGHLKSCIHSGNAGDIVYSLPTVKELGASHYVINLCSDPGSWLFGGRSISFNTARALAPLLLSQPYIKRVTITASNLPLEFLDQPMEGIDFKLDTFRLQEPCKHHLAICHALAFGVQVNLFEQWLSVVPDKKEKDYIVVSLTPRYRSLTREFWVEALSGLDNVIALGVPQEFHCMAGIQAEFVTCSDFLEMAKIIKGSRLFIGNPSLAYAIAEGLKVPRIVELPTECQNAYPIGMAGHIAPQTLPEARNLIQDVLSDLSTEGLRYRNETLSQAVGNLTEVLQNKETLDGNLEEALRNRDTHIGNLEEVLKNRDARVSDLETHSRNLEEVLRHRDARVSDLETHSRNLEEALRYRATHIANLEEALLQKDSYITDLEEALLQKDSYITDLEEALRQKDSYIADMEEALRQKGSYITDMEEVMRQKESYIGHLQESLHHRITHIGQLEAHVTNQHEALRHRDAHIGDLEGHIANLEGQLRQRDEKLYAIYTSHGWKLLSLYYKIRDRLLPANSGRRKVIKYLWNLPKRKHDSTTVRLTAVDKVKRGFLYLEKYGLKAFLHKVREKMSAGNTDYLSRPPTPELHLPVVLEDKITPFDNVVVSVIIPTKNAGEAFEPLMSVLRQQKGFKKVEIVVVDSGSDDGTLEIARSYGAKVIEIPPEKFSHSYARNLGADNATGDCLFFTVQDALPPSAVFLYKLYAIMKDNGLSAVSCSEFPREDSDLFYNVLLWNHYRFLGVNDGDRILSMPEQDDYVSLRQNGQLSDIACLISRKIFLKYRYRNDYAEDLDLGIRLIRDGARIALLSSVKIIHSHNRPPVYFLKRGYVDNVFLSKVFADYLIPSLNEEKLFQDIVLTYYAINTLITDVLPIMAVPLSACELFDAIEQDLRSFHFPEFAVVRRMVDKGCPDIGLSAFLRRIGKLCPALEDRKYPLNDTLVPAVLNTLSMVREYMSVAYPVVDVELREELKACILKSFALQCGAHLAYCYLKEGPLVREFHDELKGGV